MILKVHKYHKRPSSALIPRLQRFPAAQGKYIMEDRYHCASFIGIGSSGILYPHRILHLVDVQASQ